MQHLWQAHYQILLIIKQKKSVQLNVKIVIVFLNMKVPKIKHKCLSGNKDYSNKLDGKSKKKFKNIFKFSNNDINKFILLLRKFVYPYEYMND